MSFFAPRFINPVLNFTPCFVCNFLSSVFSKDILLYLVHFLRKQTSLYTSIDRFQQYPQAQVYIQYKLFLEDDYESSRSFILSPKFLLQLYYFTMLSIFRSRDFRKAESLLNDLGFYGEEFDTFQPDQIANKLRINTNLLHSTFQVLKEMKISPLRTVKAVLVILEIIHTIAQRSTFQKILDYLQQLQGRIMLLLKTKKSLKQSDSFDSINSSKDLEEMNSNNYNDFGSIIMGKIVLTIIRFEQRYITSFQMLKEHQKSNVKTAQSTWVMINLLRKLVQMAVDIESLGRYYQKQSLNAVLSIIRGINHDIQSLYRQIRHFFQIKMISFEEIFKQPLSTVSVCLQKEGLQQFLILIEEIQQINEKIQLIYHGKYYAHYIAKFYIYPPSLFDIDKHLQLFLKIQEYRKQITRKKKSTSFSKNDDSRRPRKGIGKEEQAEDI